MAPGTHATRFASFAQFYPFYLGEHHNAPCRLFPLLLSLGLTAFFPMPTPPGSWLWLPVALVCGYGFAWVGHFFFEKNRPATFSHPIYSLMGDWVMFKDICTGKIRL